MRALLTFIFVIATASVASVAYADMPSCNSEKDGDPYGDEQGCNGDEQGCNGDEQGCNGDADGCSGDGCGSASGASRAASIGSSLGLMAAVAYGIGRRRTE